MHVYALRSQPVRLTSALVIGPQRALLVDTGSGPDQAVRLLAAVRRLTDLPLAVANTHDHWDHFFGNASCAEAGVTDFYGSPGFARDSPGSAWLQHAEASEHAFDLPSPEELLVPVTVLEDGATIDLGPDAAVEALVASGHTDTDLVLRAGPILLVGDLLEEGAPPRAGLDATPVAWVRTLDRLLTLPGITRWVPGHGAPVDRAFAQAQRDDLAAFAATADADATDGAGADSLPTRTMSAAADDEAPDEAEHFGVRITRLL